MMTFAGVLVVLGFGESALFSNCSLSEPPSGEFEQLKNVFSRYPET